MRRILHEAALGDLQAQERTARTLVFAQQAGDQLRQLAVHEVARRDVDRDREAQPLPQPFAALARWPRAAPSA